DSKHVENSKHQEGQLQRYSRLTSPAVELDNEEGIVNASGPGVVHIHQLEAEDENATPGSAKPATPTAGSNRKEPSKQLVLTRVSYLSRMYANNRERTATFYTDV